MRINLSRTISLFKAQTDLTEPISILLLFPDKPPLLLSLCYPETQTTTRLQSRRVRRRRSYDRTCKTTAGLTSTSSSFRCHRFSQSSLTSKTRVQLLPSSKLRFRPPARSAAIPSSCFGKPASLPTIPILIPSQFVDLKV